jgi:hypothetical protein
MKVQLDFIHRNDDAYSNNHSYCNDGPLQLIRPMPNQLRPYVTTEDYNNFCIEKIDPLIEKLYEQEKSFKSFRTCFMIISLVLFGIAGLSLYQGTEGIFLAIWFIVLMLIMLHLCVQCYYSGHHIHREIRAECENMSNHCSRRNIIVAFELVMKRVWEGADEHGTHYSRKVSHISVTIRDKNDSDDDADCNSCYKQLPCC